MVNPTPSATPLMYLPASQWSPRYDSTFYTIKFDGFELIEDKLPEVPNSLSGKTNLPAYYYRITVYQEHETKQLLRRYSHFRWLYREISSNPVSASNEQPQSSTAIRMPRGSICFLLPLPQNDKFAKERQEQLSEFLEDVLGRGPEYANHTAVKTFLELE